MVSAKRARFAEVIPMPSKSESEGTGSSTYYRIPQDRLDEFRVQARVRLGGLDGSYYEIPRDQLEQFQVPDDEVEGLSAAGNVPKIPMARGMASFPKGFPPRGHLPGGSLGGGIGFISRGGGLGGPPMAAAGPMAAGPMAAGPSSGEIRFISRGRGL